MMKLICKYCGEEIIEGERTYEVDDGLVHVECSDEYCDDVWGELNVINKLQLLSFSTCAMTNRERWDGDDE